MPTVKIQAQLSTNDLLQAVEQLNPSELEDFVRRVIELKAHKQTPALAMDEAGLLMKINQRMSSDIQEQYRQLVEKRKTETLSSAEHHELIRLTKQIEQFDVKRMKCLAELAGLRRISINSLLEELQIKASYV